MRGYLWEGLSVEVEAEFSTLARLGRLPHGFNILTGCTMFRTDDPAEDAVNPWDWRRNRSRVMATGILPRRDKPPKIERTKNALRELREERERKRMEKAKLPRDREGTTLHFKILARHNEQADGSAEIREVDGYLIMNLNPDGKTLREIFVRVGKAGGSDAMYDELAKQISHRLQEGVCVEEVFRPHVGTHFGDFGEVLGVRGIKRCRSVPDLIARVVIGRFGEKTEEKEVA